MPTRRRLLFAGAALAAWSVAAAAGGHTPYRQWAVYRRKHLLVGTCRADAPTYPLGKRVVAALEAGLPESRPRVTRARDRRRLASLVATGQIATALFSAGDAQRLQAGAPPFEAAGPTPLAALFRFGAYRLVCRPDFPDRHAWLVARALSAAATDFENAGLATASAQNDTPPHPGALAFAAGAAEPPPPPEAPPLPEIESHTHP